tara:strand:- start:772 stop:1368 length:597 start_codon:yes stop_codon:yes gene_type:complete
LDELPHLLTNKNNQAINQIKDITNKAMNGDITFDESLNERLKILKINDKLLDDGIKLIKNKITKTFLQNSDFIKNNKDNIYIISGGFSEFINPIAETLGFKSSHIFCNSFLVNNDVYEIDSQNIMSKNKGKVEVTKNLNLNGKTIVIGDGYTDYEIKKYGYADIFIAYTEHVDRANVSKLADYKSKSFTDIIKYINNL